MKIIRFIAGFALFITTAGCLGMDVMRTRFIDDPNEDIVIIVTQDDQEFSVSKNLAEKLVTIKNLIEDAGIENPIPLPNVAARELEGLLILIEKGTLNAQLSLQASAELLAAADFLDMDKDIISVLKDVVASKLSIEVAKSYLVDPYLAKATVFLLLFFRNNPQIESYKLEIIMRLIEDLGLYQFMPEIWNAKQAGKAQGWDLIGLKVVPVPLPDAERLHRYEVMFETLIGSDDYMRIKELLFQKYISGLE
jgi:hypothetical protein